MANDPNQTFTINLPVPSEATDGRIYIVRGINMPEITSYLNAAGWMKVNNITESYYSSNKLY